MRVIFLLRIGAGHEAYCAVQWPFLLKTVACDESKTMNKDGELKHKNKVGDVLWSRAGAV